VLNGRNPFVDLKAPERTQNYDGNLGGTIIPAKSSFSLFIGGRRQWDTPVATYTTAAGKESILLGRRPNNGWNGQGMAGFDASQVSAQARTAESVMAAARKALGGEALVPIEFEIQMELPDKYSRRDEFPAQDAGPAISGFVGDAVVLMPRPVTPPPRPGAPEPPPGQQDGVRQPRRTRWW